MRMRLAKRRVFVLLGHYVDSFSLDASATHEYVHISWGCNQRPACCGIFFYCGTPKLPQGRTPLGVRRPGSLVAYQNLKKLKWGFLWTGNGKLLCACLWS